MNDKREQESSAYLWAFFTGEGDGAECISLAISKGNDALAWQTLNQGKPLFSSEAGEYGLRDPFLIRAHDGSRFYLIATDLKIANRHGHGFHTAQIDGSRHIEIFVSDDLVHWSKQRHVEVSGEFAGNTWAPKAFWCEEIKQYVVFWASNLYSTDDIQMRSDITYNRMIYVTTEDFLTFSEPKVWVDVDRGQGKGTIDAVIAKEDGVYYRFMKEEETMTIRLDRSADLLATVSGGSYASDKGPLDQWVTLGEKVANGLPNGEGKLFTGGEGPCIFPANPGDLHGYRWYLFIDQPNYHGGPNHYIGFASNDLTVPNSWVSVADKLRLGLPKNADGGKPRHGSIISITETEYERIVEAYG
ncbi:glycoside hydrolase family 43 protein [Gracilibacillus alcaliphilus]|uniref:glycoside hydrolase family 43 protein n=1 Tax=Gracilibacillus alcaliphilus TaxID=1401441 RepID=UPI00195EF7AC|nr:glycoside hydrolase family 43 protein [Gracilibacillus alcaliphilus]MBM7675695.1 hypothetical protein [Gracilibacillus alcaliphilus]